MLLVIGFITETAAGWQVGANVAHLLAGGASCLRPWFVESVRGIMSSARADIQSSVTPVVACDAMKPPTEFSVGGGFHAVWGRASHGRPSRHCLRPSAVRVIRLDVKRVGADCFWGAVSPTAMARS